MEKKKYIFTLSAILLSMFSLNVCATEFGNATDQTTTQTTIGKTEEYEESIQKERLLWDKEQGQTTIVKTEKTTKENDESNQQEENKNEEGFSEYKNFLKEQDQKTTEQGEKFNKNVILQQGQTTTVRTGKKIEEKDKINEENEFTNKNNIIIESNLKKKNNLDEYENKEYKLEVKYIEKNEKYGIKERIFLIYRHKKTGAYIVMILFEDPFEDTEELEDLRDYIYFVNYTNADFFLTNHFLEHTFLSKMWDKYIIFSRFGMNKINGDTDDSTINLNCILDSFKDENIISIFIDMIESAKYILKFWDKEKQEEYFKKEIHSKIRIGDKFVDIGRIFHELVKKFLDFYEKNKEKYVELKNEDYEDFLLPKGLLKGVKEYSIKKIQDAYDDIIHPSNSIMFLHVLKDPKKVQELLETASASKFFNDVKFKNYFEINKKGREEQEKNTRKVIKKFLKDHPIIKLYSDGEGVTSYIEGNERKCTKYRRRIFCKFNVDELKFSEKCMFNYIKSDAIQKILGENIKKLGYEFVKVYTHDTGELEIIIGGNNRAKFDKEILENNVKCILIGFFKKISKLDKKNDEKIFEIFDKEYIKNSFNSFKKLEERMLESYKKYGNPLDEKEICYDQDRFIVDEKSIKQNIIDSLNILKNIHNNLNIELMDFFVTTDIKPPKRLTEEERNKNKIDNMLFVLLNFGEKMKSNSGLNLFILEKVMKFVGRIFFDKGYIYTNMYQILSYEEPALLLCRLTQNEEEIAKYWFENDLKNEMKKYEESRESFLENIREYINRRNKQKEKIEKIIKKYKEYNLIERLIGNSYEEDILPIANYYVDRYLEGLAKAILDIDIYKDVKETFRFIRLCNKNNDELKKINKDREEKKYTDKYYQEEYAELLKKKNEIIDPVKNNVLGFIEKETNILNKILDNEKYLEKVKLYSYTFPENLNKGVFENRINFIKEQVKRNGLEDAFDRLKNDNYIEDAKLFLLKDYIDRMFYEICQFNCANKILTYEQYNNFYNLYNKNRDEFYKNMYLKDVDVSKEILKQQSELVNGMKNKILNFIKNDNENNINKYIASYCEYGRNMFLHPNEKIIRDFKRGENDDNIYKHILDTNEELFIYFANIPYYYIMDEENFKWLKDKLLKVKQEIQDLILTHAEQVGKGINDENSRNEFTENLTSKLHTELEINQEIQEKVLDSMRKGFEFLEGYVKGEKLLTYDGILNIMRDVELKSIVKRGDYIKKIEENEKQKQKDIIESEM